MDIKKFLGIKDSVDISTLIALKDTLTDSIKEALKDSKEEIIDEGYICDSKQNNKMLIVLVCLIIILPLVIALAFYFGVRSASDRTEDMRKLNEGREMLHLKRQERFAKIKSRHMKDEDTEDTIFED